MSGSLPNAVETGNAHGACLQSTPLAIWLAEVCALHFSLGWESGGSGQRPGNGFEVVLRREDCSITALGWL